MKDWNARLNHLPHCFMERKQQGRCCRAIDTRLVLTGNVKTETRQLYPNYSWC